MTAERLNDLLDLLYEDGWQFINSQDMHVIDHDEQLADRIFNTIPSKLKQTFPLAAREVYLHSPSTPLDPNLLLTSTNECSTIHSNN